MVKRFKTQERVYNKASVHIHGFQQCCSAAILHGISGWSSGVRRYPKGDAMPEVQATLKRIIQPDPVRSIQEYTKLYSKHLPSVLGISLDVAFAQVLEEIYIKASTGEGGKNMYASSTYHTHTWFMADRRREAYSLSCLNFMLWLRDLGVQQVGRIHISPWRPGAHGGDCKGAVYAPNLTRVKDMLDEYVEMLNEHVSEVCDMYDVDPMEVHDIHTEAVDDVGELW